MAKLILIIEFDGETTDFDFSYRQIEASWQSIQNNFDFIANAAAEGVEGVLTQEEDGFTAVVVDEKHFEDK